MNTHSSYDSEEFRGFFSQFGTVAEHQIIRDHETNRSRGFGFIVFDSEEVVDEILTKGNMIDMEGTQVSSRFNILIERPMWVFDVLFSSVNLMDLF